MADKRYIGFGKQTVYNTAVSATRWIESIESLEPAHNWIIPDSIASRSARKKNFGPYRVRGDIGAFPVEPENIGEILYGVFGSDGYSVTNPVSGVYLHQFRLGDTLKSYTIPIGLEIIQRVLVGCLFDGLRLNFRSGEDVKATARIFGVAGPEGKESLGTPTLSPLQAFVASSVGTLTIAGADKKNEVYEVEVNLANNIPDRGSLGSRYPPVIRSGQRVVGGKLSLYFDTDTEYDRFRNGTEFALALQVVGPVISGAYNYYLDLLLNKCVYLSDTAHVKPLNEPLALEAPFRAFHDSTYTECQIKLQNTIATYA